MPALRHLHPFRHFAHRSVDAFDLDQLPQFAEKLVRSNVDVIVVALIGAVIRAAFRRGADRTNR